MTAVEPSMLEVMASSVRSGDRRAVARAITVAARGGAAARRLLDSLPEGGPRAQRIGVTGPPGVGKSTLIGGLLRLLAARGERAAVVACDPRSPLSGGAFLGDRMRMAPGADPDGRTFIRSLASRGPGADLPEEALAEARILEAAGYGRIILETPGAGQMDSGIARQVDTAVVVLSPELGDEFQALKAGLLEVAHVLVVNRADRPGAEALAGQLEEEARGRAERPDIVKTVATSGEGLERLLETLDRRRQARLEKEAKR